MSDKGSFIEVELDALAGELPALVRELRQNHRRVRVVQGGTPLAELTPVRPISQLATFPELGPIQFNGDPTSPLTDEDWPEDAR